MKTNRREGFWKSKSEPDLPVPRARIKPWKGRAKFIKALEALEATARSQGYKGSSTCRCCEARNGSEEYKHGGFVWPSGLLHYIVDHNVKPSAEFIAMVHKDSQ